MISQSFIEEIQTRTDVVELISSYLPLKRAGRNFKALCPFHGEKTASFIVSPQKQIFHCFGCGQGGGAYQFLILIEKITFPEAVEMLAKRLGLVVPYEGSKTGKTKTLLYDVVNEASLFFHSQLKSNHEYVKAVVNYLKKRGLSEDIIDKFRIGFAPANNDLLSYMRKKGFTLQILENASLIVPQKQGYRDLFRERIIFPIFDSRFRVVAFGARTCKDTANSPKYINSLESALYRKRDHLYGLNFSKEDISKANTALVVEGYLDMILPFKNGIKNIVASLGTALTLEQIRLIKRYAASVILIFDSDKAGKLAALRSVDLLLDNDLEVKIADLPAGFDPDSLVREKGSDSFRELISNKRDFFDYKLEALKNTYDIKSIDGKSKIAKEMFVTIDKLSSEIGKYEYIKKFASALDIKEEILIAEYRRLSKSANLRQKSQAQPCGLNREGLPNLPISITEKILLKCMIVNQKAFLLVKKNLKEEDFNSYLAKKTVAFLYLKHEAKAGYSASSFLSAADDKEISSFLSELLMDENIPLDKNIFKESLFKLRRKKTNQVKEVLKNKIKEAEAQKDNQKLKELIDQYGKINNKLK